MKYVHETVHIRWQIGATQPYKRIQSVWIHFTSLGLYTTKATKMSKKTYLKIILGTRNSLQILLQIKSTIQDIELAGRSIFSNVRIGQANRNVKIDTQNVCGIYSLTTNTPRNQRTYFKISITRA